MKNNEGFTQVRGPSPRWWQTFFKLLWYLICFCSLKTKEEQENKELEEKIRKVQYSSNETDKEAARKALNEEYDLPEDWRYNNNFAQMIQKDSIYFSHGEQVNDYRTSNLVDQESFSRYGLLRRKMRSFSWAFLHKFKLS